MDRRRFIQNAGLAALLPQLMAGAPHFVPAHNWDGYDFGSGPAVTDRLNQGPFPTYAPEDVLPGSEVIMATTPSKERVHNYGMGLVTYISDEMGPPKTKGETLEKSIEKLVDFSLTDLIYLRVDWRDIQSRPGRLDFCDHWKIACDLAKAKGKRIGFRIQLMSPDITGESMPDFLLKKVPLYTFGQTKEIGLPGKILKAPQFDHPAFTEALAELDGLLSAQYNGDDHVEFMDTYMYGFWGEGHTWPFPDKNPFSSYTAAEKTFVDIFEMQARNWSRIPLLTNTQPDYSRVGNSEIVDRTIRTHNWLRTDTIFIENMQIESLSNRPAWTGALVENGISDGSESSLRSDEGQTRSDSIIYHARDVGANYFSLWNWHKIQAERLQAYYQKFPDALNEIASSIGYRLRPSWIWSFEKDEQPGFVLGMTNDGRAGVPGVLRITIRSQNGEPLTEGCLDAGYPRPGKVRQAMFLLPKDTQLMGLRISAQIEVKGRRFPVRWACHQQLEIDGSLRVRRNI